MLEGSFKVKFVAVEVPEEGTLPVPVQPVHTYWVLLCANTGEMTDSEMVVPASAHALDGSGEPNGEVTVRKYSCVHVAVTFIGPLRVMEVTLSLMDARPP